MIQQQVCAALSLLCRFGGIGSKSRNAYGSLKLKTPQTLSIDEVEQAASNLRQQLNLSNVPHGTAETSVLNDRELLPPIATPWKNYWFVMDQLGFSIQDFCQSTGQKRAWVKEAFGLPRKIGVSDNDGSQAKGFKRSKDKTGQQVVWLGQAHPYLGKRTAEDMRHSSPIHLHIGRNDDGTYTISAIAIPNRILPDQQTSRRELTALIAHLKVDLANRIADHSSSKAASNPAASTKRPSGAPVRVKVVRVRDKGGYHVQEEGRSEGVLNLGPIPTPPPNIGDDVEVLIKDDAKPPQYQWKNPDAPAKLRNAKKKGPRR